MHQRRLQRHLGISEGVRVLLGRLDRADERVDLTQQHGLRWIDRLVDDQPDGFRRLVDIEIADMRIAWDTLDVDTREKIKGLVVEHSRIFSKGTLGFPFTEKELRDFAPVRQPLVRTHPRSGRQSLFLSSHAGRIVGWPQLEALMLLRELTEHATQREFVYRHTWRVGDVVMWDNQATMHRGRPFDDLKYPRDLRRTTLTCGEPAKSMITQLA